MASLLVGSACPAGDDQQGSDETTGGPGSTSPATTQPGSGPGGDDGDDDTAGCVEGALGCICLDGQCANPHHCVDGECVMGPAIEIDDPIEVLAGLAVPLEAEVMAESYEWSQVDGPAVEILGNMTPQIVVLLPPELAPGDTIVLRLTAMQNTVEDFRETSITILEPVFEDFLAAIDDPNELGTTEGIAFDPSSLMWVVSTEGFVSQFDAAAQFLQRVDVPGTPVGAARMDESIVIANAGMAAVQQINSVSGNLSTLFDAIDGGGTLGAVNYPVIDGGGRIYVSNRTDGQVIRWAMDDDGNVTTSVFLDGLTNPNALAFGPEGNDALYVGTQGHVLRVSVEPGGIAGAPQEYLTLPSDADITYEVDGLAFDEGQNLWVGCPNAETLFVARYVGAGPTTPIRQFETVGAGYSYFVSTVFGRGDFGDDWLYWTNLGGGTVGRLRVGLRRL